MERLMSYFVTSEFQSYRSFEISQPRTAPTDLYKRYLTSWNIWLDLTAPTLPRSQFSICVKIHLSSTFSLESDPLPKCYHFRKMFNSPIYFSASWLCFPHYIGSLTRRQKQIIDNISCVPGVTWVNRITENHHWLVIIVSQQPTPLIVILSYTATLGGLHGLSFYKFYPQSAFIVSKIELEPDDQSEPHDTAIWSLCSFHHLL